jgi:hypothetical protein
MARRTFDVIDVTEILVHWHAGRSLNEMSQSLGVDRKTIRKYIAPAVAAGELTGRGPVGHRRVREPFEELVERFLAVVDGGFLVVGERDGDEHPLEVGLRFEQLRP